MQDGKQVLAQIAQETNRAEGEVARTGALLRDLRGQQEQLRAEAGRALAQLAKVRLGELAANRIASGLDQADQQAVALLSQRQQEQQRLLQQIEQSAAAQTELAAQRSRCLSVRDEAAARQEQQTRATLQRLAGDEDHAQRRGNVEQLTAQAMRADAKADQAEADRDRKRQPYEQDRLFAYLWRRRYRFPEYRALPLFKTLDDWVAGLCRYDTAHRDYGLLLEIPVRLRQHADGQLATAKAAADELAAREQQALADDGVPALAAEVAARQQDVDRANAAIDAAEDARDALQQRRVALDSGADEHSVQALAAVTQQLQREDVQTLQRDAAATPTAADDELVRSIDSLRARQAELDREIERATAPHENAQRALGELNDLRRRFRQQDFDAGHSVFEPGLDLGGLLGGLLRGVMQSGAAWDQLRRHQRFRRTATTGGDVAGQILGGILSSVARASRSRSSFGGFGGGGGGGGGFRSGGGFGGGGFRTGGGF